MGRSFLLLVGCLALAACDLASAPEDGSSTVPEPTELRLTSSSLNSVTISWTDDGSPKLGVRVERAVGLPPDARFETLSVLPPEATTFTDSSVRIGRPFTYRVSPVLDGETESVPEGTISLRYPATLVPLDTALAGGGAFSADGETSYHLLRTPGAGLAAVDTRTGRVRGVIEGEYRGARMLADGRVALYAFDVGAPDQTEVLLVRGATIERRVRVSLRACAGADNPSVAVSADGARAVASCEFAGVFVSWSLDGSPMPVVSRHSVFTYLLESISLDGRVAYAATTAAGNQVLTAIDVATGRPLWTAPVRGAWATLSPDGTSFIGIRHAGGLATIDAATGMVRAVAERGRVPGRFSPGGEFVMLVRGGGMETYEVVRTSDLSPVAVIEEGHALLSGLRPTATGVEGFRGGPAPGIVRYDFSHGWEVVREMRAL